MWMVGFLDSFITLFVASRETRDTCPRSISHVAHSLHLPLHSRDI